jgi:hypothetical protein
MFRHHVSTPAEALAYITDCTLATVEDLTARKSAGKHETQRQIAIAQRGVDWMRDMDVDFSTTRAAEVVKDYGGSVEAWARRHRRDNAEKS